ncbi:hypothetical protein SNE40_022343 [Patella caerulea]|uniref:MACPF domain-containing protein n=1 Tax=Patella caerulea TaxID=87958 RepID=A0AAN8FW80_PATCE
MHISGLALLVVIVTLVNGWNPGINFVGIGYNLLKANPEGGAGGAGGVDPGLNVVNRVLQLSQGSVPKEVRYQHAASCQQTKESYVYYGTHSYQSRLKFGLKLSGEGNAEVEKAAFSLSAGYNRAYQETNKKGNVFFDDETICNYGTARFSEELALMHNLHVTDNFAAAVCNLPILYSPKVYMQFLDEWGTHYITEVNFGTKVIYRYQSSLSEFIKHVQTSGGVGFSAEGSYQGFGASFGVDFNRYKSSDEYRHKFGQQSTTLHAGNKNTPEPIGLTIKTISEALNSDYWWGQNVAKACGHPLTFLQSKKQNLVKALKGYGKFKLFTPHPDPQLRIPLTWPSGTYGLVKAITGCPAGRVTWHPGKRHQGDNSKRHKGHMSHIYTGGHSVTIEFCMKGDNRISEYDTDWPKGNYCILKYGSCPAGFNQGSIYWDDPTSGGNTNSKSGTLPDGVYNADTRMDFCCRQDDLPAHDIYLPTEKPFTLLRYTRECQRVHGMGLTEHTMTWGEEHLGNHNSVSGAHPFDDGGANRHKLHICQYAAPGSIPTTTSRWGTLKPIG